MTAILGGAGGGGEDGHGVEEDGRPAVDALVGREQLAPFSFTPPTVGAMILT